MKRNRGAFVGMSFDGVVTKVFDVEKKKLIREFENASAAADFLGVSIHCLTKAKLRKTVIKKTTNRLNKLIAIR